MNFVFLNRLLLLIIFNNLLNTLSILEQHKSSTSLIDQISLSFWFQIFQFPFIKISVFISKSILVLFINSTILKFTHNLYILNLHYSVSIWLVIYPFAIILRRSLVLSRSILHSFPKLSNINVLSSYQLPQTIIKVIFKISNKFMDRVCQLTISLFHSIIKLTFIELVFIQVVTIFIELSIINLSNKNMFCPQKLFFLSIKFNLFSLETRRPTTAKREFILTPIINYKLILSALQAVLIILYNKAGNYLMIHYIRDFFIMELQKIWKRFSKQQPWKRNIRDFVGYQWWELFTSFSINRLLTLILHYLVIVALLFFLFTFVTIFILIIFAILHPIFQLLVSSHYTDQLQFQEIVKFVSNHIFASLISECFLFFNNLINLCNKTFLYFRKRFPRNSRFLFLNRTIFQIYQHFNTVVIRFLQETVCCSQKKASFISLLKFTELMKILNMERHRHKVISAKSSQRKSILTQRLHIFADRLRVNTKSAQSWKQCQQRNNE